MKDLIENKNGINILLKHNKDIEPSRIFCDRIEYMHDKQKFEGKSVLDHHLMFYLGKKLVFKVWLKQNREYKNIEEALKDVGILVV